jgi:hypothetical protein
MRFQGREQDVAQLITDVRTVGGPDAQRAPDLLDLAVTPDEDRAWQVAAEVGAQLRPLP